MKFRFCGDGDCPDWALSEIHSALSVLSSVKLRILAQMVAKAILEEEDIPELKLNEIIASNNLDKLSAKSSVACLRFLLISASTHNVDGSTFDKELQQLGLPKEHSAAICKVFSQFAERIRKALQPGLKINELESLQCYQSLADPDYVEMNVNIKNEIIDGIPQPTEHLLNIHKSELKILINELEMALKVIDEFSMGG